MHGIDDFNIESWIEYIHEKKMGRKCYFGTKIRSNLVKIGQNMQKNGKISVFCIYGRFSLLKFTTTP